MNDLQKVQLEILKEFIQVCEKNNLQYFLDGGTLLGAVRHKGFIPWDDDIDIAMPREDYDKFIKLKNQFPSYYFVQNYKTDPHFIYNFTKIRDSRTTFIENTFMKHRINHGVWIDIFPFDGFSKKIKPGNRFIPRVVYMWWNLYAMYIPALLRKIHLRTFFTDILLNISALIFYIFNPFHLRNRWVDFIARRRKYRDCELVGYIMNARPKIAAFKKEYLGEGTYLEFEGLKVKVPSNYDAYLTHLYGDYMKLPPVEKQIGHHYNKGFSLEIGYEEYMKKHRI